MSQQLRNRSLRVLVIALRRLQALFIALSIAEGAGAQNTELRVMSFNIRYSKVGVSEAAKENNWTDPEHPRRKRAIQVILDNAPDVLGVQEARALQVDDLREAVPQYDFYGIGRDDGKTGGEFSGIFYRKDRFTRKDAGSFWLSATPEKPGTSFYTVPGAVPRIASWLRLADKESGRDIVVLNMHWDHISEDARRQSATLIRKRLASLAQDLPTVVMGDLNSKEDSPAVKELIGTGEPVGRALADSYREVHPERSPDEASFNNWKGTTAGSRIDFILHTDEFKPIAAEIVRTSYDHRWPSDHYPVTAVLRFGSQRSSRQ